MRKIRNAKPWQIYRLFNLSDGEAVFEGTRPQILEKFGEPLTYNIMRNSRIFMKQYYVEPVEREYIALDTLRNEVVFRGSKEEVAKYFNATVKKVLQAVNLGCKIEWRYKIEERVLTVEEEIARRRRSRDKA